jgi:HK97 family phage major capsid protein/HK97 family phage prohead protease
MPKPKPTETHPQWMDRCMKVVMGDGSASSQDQAIAMCSSMWEQEHKPGGSMAGGTMMGHAYSILNIKSIDNEQRIIEGIASTPTPDRVGDVVDPMGAKFALPMPLLWQHDSKSPIGNVMHAEATKEGIAFKARIAQSHEPGKLKDRLDEAWQSIKLGLVRAVSIGFRSLESEPIDKKSPWKGEIFKKWEWMELSAVTIPANMEANINVIRSLDTELRAATGNVQQSVSSAGVSAPKQTKTVKAEEAKPMAKKTVAEQISAFEATRAAKSARLTSLMDEATEKGETLAETESQEYENLKTEIKSVDEHLVRMHEMEKLNAVKAVPVTGDSIQAANVSRGAVAIQVKPNRPPGIGFARIALAKMAAYKTQRDPMSCAEQLWPSDPDIADYFKTAVAPGNTVTTGWGSQLVISQNMPSEFVEFLRPLTILGRVPGFRHVPFNITIPRQTAGTSAQWVGEAKAKPVGKITLDNINLRFTKVAIISVFSEELARFSNPSVETLVRDDLAGGMAQYLDEQFFDPSVSAVPNLSPASITNGADNASASGATIADVISDLLAAINNFQSVNIDTNGVVIAMQAQLATQIGMMRNALGQNAFPTINSSGGTLFGFPVYVSTSVGNGRIVVFKPSECLVADDGGVTVDVSNQASLQMDDNPTSGAQSLVSLWQSNQIGVRCERFINWVMRRDDAVYYISSANYGTGGTA